MSLCPSALCPSALLRFRSCFRWIHNKDLLPPPALPALTSLSGSSSMLPALCLLLKTNSLKCESAMSFEGDFLFFFNFLVIHALGGH